MGSALADIKKWPFGVILNCVRVIAPDMRVLRLHRPCVRHTFRHSSVAVLIYRCLDIATITARYHAYYLGLSHASLVIRPTGRRRQINDVSTMLCLWEGLSSVVLKMGDFV
jgi:hypothetical protein